MLIFSPHSGKYGENIGLHIALIKVKGMRISWISLHAFNIASFNVTLSANIE
jgi:hypothetical protein